jgi:hypothetical protein
MSGHAGTIVSLIATDMREETVPRGIREFGELDKHVNAGTYLTDAGIGHDAALCAEVTAMVTVILTRGDMGWCQACPAAVADLDITFCPECGHVLAYASMGMLTGRR